MVLFGEDRLRRRLAWYPAHCNEGRRHHGIGNEPIGGLAESGRGEVVAGERMGGRLKSRDSGEPLRSTGAPRASKRGRSRGTGPSMLALAEVTRARTAIVNQVAPRRGATSTGSQGRRAQQPLFFECLGSVHASGNP